MSAVSLSDNSMMPLVSYSSTKLLSLLVVFDGVVVLSIYSLWVLCSLLLLDDCNILEPVSGVFIPISLFLDMCLSFSSIRAECSSELVSNVLTREKTGKRVD